MKRTIITISTILIILGVIALCLNMALGNQTVTYLKRIYIYETDLTFYEFNFKDYITNIKLSIDDTSILSLEIPNNRTWQTLGLTDFGEALGNNLAIILNWFLFIINVIIYPFRIGAYILKNILAIIGVNMDTTASENGLAWLISLVNFFIERIQIPYV